MLLFSPALDDVVVRVVLLLYAENIRDWSKREVGVCTKNLCAVQDYSCVRTEIPKTFRNTKLHLVWNAKSLAFPGKSTKKLLHVIIFQQTDLLP